MSTASETIAVAPKRQRGRDRVEAILEAATALFHEKTYEAVTMTEIAARSDTAIGSLYRFFPTKEAIAGALLGRYGAKLIGALDAVVDRAGELTAADAAEGLLGVVQGLRRDRSVAVALINAEIGPPQGRPSLRAAMAESLARLLVRLQASTGPADVYMVQHLVKLTFALPQEDARLAEALDHEAQSLMEMYLERLEAKRSAHRK